jgi:hypothetical protein
MSRSDILVIEILRNLLEIYGDAEKSLCFAKVKYLPNRKWHGGRAKVEFTMRVESTTYSI